MREPHETLIVPAMPRPKRLLLGIFAALILATITLYAELNLISFSERGFVAIGASAIWLIYGSISLFYGVQEAGGPINFLSLCLGLCVGKDLVWFERDESGPVLVYGYGIGRARFDYLYLPLHALRSIDFRPGQATALGGRDMDDWNVTLWYEIAEGVGGPAHHPTHRDNQGLCILGGSFARNKVSGFLEALVQRNHIPAVEELCCSLDLRGQQLAANASMGYGKGLSNVRHPFLVEASLP